MSLPNQRHLFDIPRDVAYFNCAYFSPNLDSVQAAGEAGVARKRHPWLVQPKDFFEDSDHLRATFARLIGAHADEIALIPSASYGTETAMNNLSYEMGQKFLVLDEQFPSNYYPWQKVAEVGNGDMVVVPRPENGDWTSAILERLNEDFAVAALPNVHWTDGSLIDLVTIGQRCKELGVPLVLDVTQSLGARPLDVKAIQPAFMVAAGYKWLLGPYSLGFLYVDPAYHRGEGLESSWMARKGSQNFSMLVNYTDQCEENARRFDVGERSNFALVPQAQAALDQLLDWGIENIESTLGTFNDAIIQRAATLGFRTLPEAHRCRHLLGLRFPNTPPESLMTDLRAENVFVSVRGDALRISPHLYNDQEDVERLFGVLKRYF